MDSEKLLPVDKKTYQSAVKLYNSGVRFFDSGNYHEAEQKIYAALEIYPFHGESHFTLGNIFLERKEFDRAVESYHKAIELEGFGNPNSALIYCNLATACGELMLHDLEEHFLYQSLQCKPTREAHHNLGLLLGKRNDMHNAERHLSAAIEIDPLLAESHYLLGLALAKRGDAAGAIRSTLRCLEIEPTHLNASMSLRVILLMQWWQHAYLQKIIEFLIRIS